MYKILKILKKIFYILDNWHKGLLICVILFIFLEKYVFINKFKNFLKQYNIGFNELKKIKFTMLKKNEKKTKLLLFLIERIKNS